MYIHNVKIELGGSKENGVVFRCQWPTDFTLEETQTTIHVYHPAQHKHDISSQCPRSPLLLHGSLYSVCVGESEHNVDAPH